MKTALKITLTAFFIFSLNSVFAQTEALKSKEFAIVKMTEISNGAFGSNLTLEIYYDDGKIIDATTLIKGYKKNKWLENFSHASYILKYMEQNGYTLVSTSTAVMGGMFLYQYVFKK